MTPTEIRSLPAGPELDALVAVHCLDWRWWVNPEGNLVGLWPPEGVTRWNWAPSFTLAGGDGLTDGGVSRYADFAKNIPHPSTSWKRAGALVDHFGAGRKDAWFAVELLMPRTGGIVWYCCWCSEDATGTTAQEAICRAAVMHALAQREAP